MMPRLEELPGLLPGALFYAFAFCILLSSCAVITVKNPVHAVLLLIFCFFNAAGLFILSGAEFIAMLTVIVYVGAVATLFLFVVMMLDVNVEELRSGYARLLPVGVLLALAVAAEILAAAFYGERPAAMAPGAVPAMVKALPNTQRLGATLYTDYFIVFHLSGLTLFLAMIGAIVLTLHHKPDSKRQKISAQIGRRRDEGVSLVKVKTGSGV
ncbi:MAG: NADH-quinone oxidoreductase subunit J [Rickettsiales bacterium]